MAKAMKGNDKVIFLTIQAVFEGQERKPTTYDKIRETQVQYDLKTPFGMIPEAKAPTINPRRCITSEREALLGLYLLTKTTT